MGRNKLNPNIVGRVQTFIGLGYSERQIIAILKKENIKISKGSINNIKNGCNNLVRNVRKNKNKLGNRKKLDSRQLLKLKKWPIVRTHQLKSLWQRSLVVPDKILVIT